MKYTTTVANLVQINQQAFVTNVPKFGTILDRLDNLIEIHGIDFVMKNWLTLTNHAHNPENGYDDTRRFCEIHLMRRNG